jgi:hypothetical protein
LSDWPFPPPVQPSVLAIPLKIRVAFPCHGPFLAVFTPRFVSLSIWLSCFFGFVFPFISNAVFLFVEIDLKAFKETLTE